MGVCAQGTCIQHYTICGTKFTFLKVERFASSYLCCNLLGKKSLKMRCIPKIILHMLDFEDVFSFLMLSM